MRLFCVFRFSTLGLLCLSLAAAAVPSDDIIRKVENRYNGARTLSLQFVENFEFQGHRRPPESGRLTLRKQGKMRWDYERPAGKLLVSDGKSLYLYTASDNRVEKMAARDTSDMRAPLAFLLGRLDLKKEFRDFEIRPGDDGTWLDAHAKSDRTAFEKVQFLAAGDGSIRRLRVLGRDGSQLAFTFDGEVLNPPADQKLFDFAIPPGAEVVNAVEFSAEGK